MVGLYDMSDLLICFSVWIRRNLSVLTSWSENESGTSSVPLLLLAIKSSGGGGAVDVLDEAKAMGNLERRTISKCTTSTD